MAKDLTDKQIDWLGKITAMKKEFRDERKTHKAKAAFLSEMQTEIGAIEKQLVEAQKFSVTWEPEKVKNFWGRTKEETTKKTMQWSEGDRDSEVDTVHDLVGNYQVDPDDAKRAIEMHGKILEIQKKMIAAVDKDGKRIFDDNDIERELWSPLVKANIIPSNAVPDTYSQEAKVFRGACAIYGEMLKEHTKTASKHENLKIGLSIAQDTIALAGTVAAEAIKGANYDGASMSDEQKRERVYLLEQKEAGTLSGSDTTKLDKLNDLTKSGRIANETAAYTSLAFGLVNGAFDIADKALDKKHEGQSWKIAEIAFNVVSNAAVAAIGGAQASAAVTGIEGNADHDVGKQDFKTATSAAQNMVRYSLSGAKVVFRFKDVLDAPPGNRTAAVKGMVVTIADAVGSAFAAFDVQRGTDSNGDVVAGTNGEFARIGSFIAAGIISAANFAEIAKIVHDSRGPDGKVNLDGRALAGAIGLNVISAVMTGTFTVASEAAREQKDLSETSLNPEKESADDDVTTSDERTARIVAQGADIAEMNQEAKKLSALFDAFPVNTFSPELMQEKTALALEKLENERRDAELKEFNEKLAKDPEFRKKLDEDIARETEEQQERIQALIRDSNPDPEEMNDPETAKRAMAAIDALIAEAQALNMKWAVIDQVTSGGVAIVTKFVPGASAAVAIRQLIMDTAVLTKKSMEVNTWRKNLALTYGNDSVYGPAIKSRLNSGIVQVSQAAANELFAMMGVATAAVQIADITGISTGMAMANNLAKALSDYSFKMHKRSQIEKGWKIYKKATDDKNKGDRKLARKAMKWNSTLSKCVLAYGIVIDGDPIAKEVGRRCGLTPEVLQDQHDVCQKVVQYFMTVYSDDPEVLKRFPQPRNWHPGAFSCDLVTWVRFKAAAEIKAVPPLDGSSTDTPQIDDFLARIDKLCGFTGYGAKRDRLSGDRKKASEYEAFLQEMERLTTGLIQALGKYRPVTAPCPDKDDPQWTPGIRHDGMHDIVEGLRAETYVLRSEVKLDEEERKRNAAQKAPGQDDGAQDGKKKRKKKKKKKEKRKDAADDDGSKDTVADRDDDAQPIPGSDEKDDPDTKEKVTT